MPRVWAVSDFHLADDTVAPMFHEDRQGRRVVELCERIRAEGDGELVLLGDFVDLTAMTPPPRGLEKFGARVGVALDAPPIRPPQELCAACRPRHEGTLRALAELSRVAPVTLVPGNHDHPFASAEGRACLDALGLERVRIETGVERRMADRTVVLQHGHELDPDNAEPGGAGEMLTRVLHHAIVPMLRQLPARANVSIDPRRVVALRPEERVVPVMRRWLTEDRFAAFVDALLDLMVDIGALSRVEAWLTTPERLRERLDDADDLWERIGAFAHGVLAGRKPPPRPASRPDVFVLGHTHVPDWSLDDDRDRQRIYLNLGSWTDRATDAVGPFDDTLPMVRISEETRGLRVTLEELESARTLETFESAHAPGGAPPGEP